MVTSADVAAERDTDHPILLLRADRAELSRRGAQRPVTEPRLNGLAHQPGSARCREDYHGLILAMQREWS